MAADTSARAHEAEARRLLHLVGEQFGADKRIAIAQVHALLAVAQRLKEVELALSSEVE